MSQPSIVNYSSPLSERSCPTDEHRRAHGLRKQHPTPATGTSSALMKIFIFLPALIMPSNASSDKHLVPGSPFSPQTLGADELIFQTQHVRTSPARNLVPVNSYKSTQH